MLLSEPRIDVHGDVAGLPTNESDHACAAFRRSCRTGTRLRGNVHATMIAFIMAAAG